MAEGESTSSKLFWWTMGIVATILSAEIIAAVNLSGVRPAEVNPASGATTAQVNWSGLPSGAGPLRGTFVANKATFEGEIDSRAGPWDVGLDCTFSNGANVTCDYRLQAVAPNDYAPQRGSLSADKS
jgi:hypothetical protein